MLAGALGGLLVALIPLLPLLEKGDTSALNLGDVLKILLMSSSGAFWIGLQSWPDELLSRGKSLFSAMLRSAQIGMIPAILVELATKGILLPVAN